MFLYIIHTVMLQLIFLIIYDIFLKKETFFNWNRFYLILSAIASLVLPVLKIQFFSEVIPKQYLVALPELSLQQINSTEFVNNSSFNWGWVVGFGIFVALILFLYKLFKILRLVYKNPKIKQKDIYIVRLLKSEDAFSFFNYIFLGEHISEEKKPHIIAHEQAHMNGKHSLDLLFFEVLRILFWFNPLIYVFQKKIATIHEFIADSEVIKNSSKSLYYQNLLSQVFETKRVSFINPFYKESLIKKRIVMLQKSKSKSSQLLKYALLIPVLSGMLVYNSCIENIELDEEAQGISEIIVETVDTSTERSDIKEVAFAHVDSTPLFPGCESLTTEDEKRECFNEKIRTFVGQNFNISVADKLDLKGMQKISVFFKVSEIGRVSSVKSRAIHPALEEEAKRVINLLPQFAPGTQKGKNVIVPYYLPIKFVVK